MWVDSSAAKAIVSRIGLGKVRHMEVKYLWAQEAHKSGRFQVRKITGRNPADVLTKPLSATEMKEKLGSIGAELVKRKSAEIWSGVSNHGKKLWADYSESE